MVGDPWVGFLLERQADVQPEALLAARAFLRRAHDAGARAGDDHPAFVGHPLAEEPRALGCLLARRGARRAEDRHLPDRAVRREHLVRVTQLLGGRGGDLEVTRSRAILVELEHGGQELLEVAAAVGGHLRGIEQLGDQAGGALVLELILAGLGHAFEYTVNGARDRKLRRGPNNGHNPGDREAGQGLVEEQRAQERAGNRLNIEEERGPGGRNARERPVPRDIAEGADDDGQIKRSGDGRRGPEWARPGAHSAATIGRIPAAPQASDRVVTRSGAWRSSTRRPRREYAAYAMPASTRSQSPCQWGTSFSVTPGMPLTTTSTVPPRPAPPPRPRDETGARRDRTGSRASRAARTTIRSAALLAVERAMPQWLSAYAAAKPSSPTHAMV